MLEHKSRNACCLEGIRTPRLSWVMLVAPTIRRPISRRLWYGVCDKTKWQLKDHKDPKIDQVMLKNQNPKSKRAMPSYPTLGKMV